MQPGTAIRGKRTTDQYKNRCCNLNSEFFPNKNKIPSQFKDEILHLHDESFLKIDLSMLFRQVQEFKNISVLKGVYYIRMNFLQRRGYLLVSWHNTLKNTAADLPFQFPNAGMFLYTETKIEFPFFICFCAGNQDKMVCPGNLC